MSFAQKIKQPFYIILFTIFLDVLGIGILLPVIPMVLADPASPSYILPAGMSLDQGYILLGILTAIYPLMQFIAAPILGELSDSIGRKKVLAFSLGGTALGYALFAFAIVTKNIPLLFFSRALDGITGGNISVAQAAVADVSAPEKRVRNFGLMGAAFGLGFILGPFIGGKLSDHNLVPWFNAATPFWFAALLALLNVLGVLYVLPETREAKKALYIAWNRAFHNIQRAFMRPDLRGIFTSNFLFQAGFSFYGTFASVFMIDRFGATQGQIGNYFAVIGMCIIISQTLIVGRIAKRWHERQSVRVSILMNAILVLCYVATQELWQFFLIGIFLCPFISIIMANMTALISKSASPDVQGEILGINASVAALAQTIPPVIAGIIAAVAAPEVPMVVAAAVLFCGWIVFSMWARNHAALDAIK